MNNGEQQWTQPLCLNIQAVAQLLPRHNFFLELVHVPYNPQCVQTPHELSLK